MPLDTPASHEADIDTQDELSSELFQGHRLYRPKEENPVAEAHHFFGLAQDEFRKVKEFDEAGQTDTHSRYDSLHSLYAYLKQAYVMFNELGNGNESINFPIVKTFKEVKDYDLRISKMKDSNRVDYVSSIDMDEVADTHLTEQSIMPIYDSLLSTPISVSGFDPSRYKEVLGFYLHRYFPSITDLDISYTNGDCVLKITNSKELSQSERKIIDNINECMTWIGKIGAIHNMALQRNNGEMDDETQLELLEYVKQLSDLLHRVHGTTNTHKERVQRFWAKFVTDPKLAYAPMLHDDGKVGVSSEILGKPARIGSTEMDQVKGHPIGTARLLRNLLGIKNFAKFIALCSSHHMNYALKKASYPDYLPGEKIVDTPKTLTRIMKNLTPAERNALEQLELGDEDVVIFRLLALMDVLEALTGEREYRDPEAKAQIIRRIRSKAGSLFEPDIASFVFKKLKEGGFDDELYIAEDDDSEKVSDPVFYYGNDILSFLEAEKETLAREHGINVDEDIARLKNGLNFPSLKMSRERIRANIYSIFCRRDRTFKLNFESGAEVDEVLLRFLAWTMDNDKTPEQPDIESVEYAIRSVNSGLLKAVS